MKPVAEWQKSTTFSSWNELIQGVPLSSKLGSVLFKIFINHLFLAFNEIRIFNFGYQLF